MRMQILCSIRVLLIFAEIGQLNVSLADMSRIFSTQFLQQERILIKIEGRIMNGNAEMTLATANIRNL